MSELSVFVDESGNLGKDSAYYIVSLVFHDQADSLSQQIVRYNNALEQAELPYIPLHLSPLMRGNENYRGFDIEKRAPLLFRFSAFAWHIPFRYKTFVYRKSEFKDEKSLGARLRKEIILFLFEQLAGLQRYDAVKFYYDDGQKMITRALHQGFGYALGVQTMRYRNASPSDYRLAQIADFVCGIELAAVKYDRHEETATDVALFGTGRELKKNFLKKLRKKQM